ncbi:MAG TPA: hypothetical protein VF746_04300 [Longimicrobium sp.]|jgi:hypothetical protein
MKKTIKISLALGFIVAGGMLALPASAAEADCQWAERMVMGVCDGATTSLCKGSEQDCKKTASVSELEM